MNHVVVHYAEIGIKGDNRSYFERLLINNIKKKAGDFIISAERLYGYIMLDIKPAAIPEITESLASIPGISHFSFTKKAGLDIKEIKEETINLLKDKEFSTFKINTKRFNKNFRHNSMEVNSILGEEVIKAYNKKAQMKSPDLTLKVEISDKAAYLSLKDIKGIGGLPTDPRQKVVCLMSGGFDSPVAAYMMMKRGCQVILAHFHNKNQASVSVKDKIIQLAEQLSKFQIKTVLYIVPFEDIQKEIIKKVHSEIRMLVYRRFMIKIAARIAEINKARFLVVGDSLSQVASQTLDNLEATYLGEHILSPLIGFDKEEIMQLSRKIGTFSISAQPYGDCCSYFLARHPELRADPKVIAENELKIEPKLVEEALNKADVIVVGK